MNSSRPDRTVLVTGGAGFIGSHVVERLLEAGDAVRVVDDLSTGREENLADCASHPRLEFRRGDVRDRAAIRSATADCDLVIHLAAAVGVRLIVEDPVRTMETNIMGTSEVLHAAEEIGAGVLLASTSEVFGKLDSVPFSEDDDMVLGPTSRARWAYAASKIVDEFLGLAFHEKRQVPVTVFRLFNTSGPRQTGRYGMVVPRFIDQALAGSPLTVFGDGRQSRCFTHVHDAARAIVALADRPAADGRVFNIGSDTETTIYELAERVIAMVDSRLGREAGSTIELVPYDEAYPPGFEDMRRRVPETARIRRLTGWRPEKTLDDLMADILDAKLQADGQSVASG